MFQIFVNANYDFVGKRRWFYLVSGGFVVLSLVSILFRGGLNYGIDFTGGTLVQVRYDKPVTVEVVRRGLDEIKLGQAVIQQFGDAQEYLIRLHQAGEKPDALSKQVQDALSRTSGAAVEIRRLEFVGPQVGRDLQLQALYAVLAGMAGILIYVAFRFHFRDGVISVAAIAHDIIVTLGALSVTHREISLPVLAALLTIVGYSINDTIVVFDRIRETRAKGVRKGQNWADLVNAAMNQTLSRTVLTSFTVFLSALVLLLFGGEVLHDFSFALLVGVVTGTYSSVAAASLVMDWETWSRARSRTPRKVQAKA
ncbi:MAG TPA: protein translocase subunit SecF [Candidatus Acidoferrales bacterium]|jgi:preprotein translocase subunit SecF|nr:protein translocase subunit SecF [Candidatus Acidoferrales bacterium]